MTEPAKHIEDLLPSYLNDTLGAHERAQVERHIESCEDCRQELDEWASLSNATTHLFSEAPPPPAAMLSRIRSQIGIDQSPARAHSIDPSFNLQYLWQLVVGQIPLVHRGIWIAAPLTIALGLIVGFILNTPNGSGTPIAVIAPFLAAVSLTLIYGPENDPSLELALSTPTSPRLVVMSRMVIVFAYDLLISLVATAVLVAVVGGSGLLPLVSIWIGPMLFLSSFALAVALRFGTQIAITASLILWSARVFALSERAIQQDAVTQSVEIINGFWSSSPLLIGLFICMMFVTFISIPQQEKFA